MQVHERVASKNALPAIPPGKGRIIHQFDNVAAGTFRAATGETVMDRLPVLRMDHAATLRVDTNLPLTAKVGMPDQSRCNPRTPVRITDAALPWLAWGANGVFLVQ